MKALVTGGNGFVGHHFCEHLLKNTNMDIDIVDKMSYASLGYERLKDVQCYDDKRIRHFAHDLASPIEDYLLKELADCDFIIHMAAETHVDKSIDDPRPFVISNVLGTMNILNLARKCSKLKSMIYFSTDEVFGPADRDKHPKGFHEWDRYKSSNPYAATKAGGEELAIAYHNTYKLPVIITHTMNVFGERQHPEKFIPKIINKVLKNETVIIHGDESRTKAGSRFYIHARNVSDAILYLMTMGDFGDKYNVVGEKEVDNLALAQFIASVLGKELKYEIVDFHSSRPGHDLRYALNGAKLEAMGFSYKKNFEESLAKTIEWTLNNPKWLNV